MLLFEPLLCCLGRMFWVIVMLEDPSTTHFHCSHWGKEVVGQNFPVYGPIHPPLNMVKSSDPLSWETPPKHKVSTSMLHSGDGVLGVVLRIYLPPNTASRVKFSSSILVSSDHITFSQASSGSSRCSLANLHVPSSAEEPCARSRILILHGVVCYWWFSLWLWSQLPSGH